MVSTDPADVFAALGDRLVAIWYLEAATQKWTVFLPDATTFAALPDDRKLTSVSSGQIVSIILTDGASVEFAGSSPSTLYQGLNNVAVK